MSASNSLRPILATLAVVSMAIGLLQWVHGAPYLGRGLFIAGGSVLAMIVLVWVATLWQARNWRLVRIALVSGCVAVGMIGFSYGMVPMFDWLVEVLQIKGSVSHQATAVQAVPGQPIALQVVTTRHANMRWQLSATPAHVTVTPGKPFSVSFLLKNQSHHPMTGQLRLSVAPSRAAAYLDAMQTVDQPQTLVPGQSKQLTAKFRMLKSVPDVTLAYTLFDVTDKE